jgi:hypothetical protein
MKMDNFDIERECELEHEKHHYEELKNNKAMRNKAMRTMLFISGLAIIIITIIMSIVIYNTETYFNIWKYGGLCGLGLILMVIGGISDETGN